jgi:hypothetical protein
MASIEPSSRLLAFILSPRSSVLYLLDSGAPSGDMHNTQLGTTEQVKQSTLMECLQVPVGYYAPYESAFQRSDFYLLEITREFWASRRSPNEIVWVIQNGYAGPARNWQGTLPSCLS